MANVHLLDFLFVAFSGAATWLEASFEFNTCHSQSCMWSRVLATSAKSDVSMGVDRHLVASLVPPGSAHGLSARCLKKLVAVARKIGVDVLAATTATAISNREGTKCRKLQMRRTKMEATIGGKQQAGDRRRCHNGDPFLLEHWKLGPRTSQTLVTACLRARI